MATVRCPSCGKKIDTSFYGACLDCGTLLNEATTAPPSPRIGSDAPPVVAEAPPEVTLEEHIARHGEDSADKRAPGKARQFGFGMLARLAVVGVVLGGGAIWGFFFDADRDESGSIVDAGSLTADEITVGDCLDWPGSASSDEVETFTDVTARPCGEAHDLEVFTQLAYPAAGGVDYPGDDLIFDYAIDGCLSQFDQYVGQSFEEAIDLDFTLFWPSEESWDEGDRTINCLIVHVEGEKLVGTMRGRTGNA